MTKSVIKAGLGLGLTVVTAFCAGAAYELGRKAGQADISPRQFLSGAGFSVATVLKNRNVNIKGSLKNLREARQESAAS